MVQVCVQVGVIKVGVSGAGMCASGCGQTKWACVVHVCAGTPSM